MFFLYIDSDFLILIFFLFLTVHAFGMFVRTPDLQEGENPDSLFSLFSRTVLSHPGSLTVDPEYESV